MKKLNVPDWLKSYSIKSKNPLHWCKYCLKKKADYMILVKYLESGPIKLNGTRFYRLPICSEKCLLMMLLIQ